jgi:hypothetical protein
MPSVLVVPVYVEVPQGFERAVDALESYLRHAGYVIYTGEPLAEDLEQTKARLGGHTCASQPGCAPRRNSGFCVVLGPEYLPAL